MTISLLKTTTLSFTRYTAGRELLESGRFTAAATTATVVAEGSLQPFAGISQKVLPEGMTAVDARLFFTQTLLQASSQFTKIQADEVTIDGLVYEVETVMDWNQYGLTIDNYQCILVRKDEDV